jgi:hypothetical protein
LDFEVPGPQAFSHAEHRTLLSFTSAKILTYLISLTSYLLAFTFPVHAHGDNGMLTEKIMCVTPGYIPDGLEDPWALKLHGS